MGVIGDSNVDLLSQKVIQEANCLLPIRTPIGTSKCLGQKKLGYCQYKKLD